jgi:hypothetical protein
MKKTFSFIYIFFTLIKLDILLRLNGFTKMFDLYVKRYGMLGTDNTFEDNMDLRIQVGKLLVLIQLVSTFYPFGAKCIHRSLLGYRIVREKYKVPINIVVALGDISQIENEAALKNVIIVAGMGKKLNEFDKGINTVLSKEYEGGEELSGGEWQKVAICRAMLKNTNIIVLDEPTAALDPLAELEIFDLFNKVSKDKTTIMISHRLGITRFADKIIVMKNGEIAEQGRHDDLMALEGIYKKMFLAQSNWYI